MVVPRKPHPFGNEYHTIADGDDGKPIMFRIKLVEGKDRQKKKADGSWAFPSEYDCLQKTADKMVGHAPIHFHLFGSRGERCAFFGSGETRSNKTAAGIFPETGQADDDKHDRCPCGA